MPFDRSPDEERPHQHLRGGTPAARLSPLTRAYDARLPPIEYPGHFPSGASAAPAPSASSSDRSSSLTRSRPTPSASRKSPMASGQSTFVRSYSRGSMNGTTAFAANMGGRPVDAAGAVDAENASTAPWKTAQNAVSHSDHRRLSEDRVLPMLPVNSVTYLAGRSLSALGCEL